ncbi:MAG: hypothetical protein ABIM88_02275 [candidate division WOR-3 bacterium]
MENPYIKPMTVAMGATLGLSVALMAIGMAWHPVLFWGVATLLALPAIGVISAMFGFARVRNWRYFFLGLLLLGFMCLSAILGFARP